MDLVSHNEKLKEQLISGNILNYVKWFFNKILVDILI
jgi:hypothetical protein